MTTNFALCSVTSHIKFTEFFSHASAALLTHDLINDRDEAVGITQGNHLRGRAPVAPPPSPPQVLTSLVILNGHGSGSTVV